LRHAQALNPEKSGEVPGGQELQSRRMTALFGAEAAEKRLEEATQVREGDRMGTAAGGSRLKPEYHERVRDAEAEVERAKKKQWRRRRPIDPFSSDCFIGQA
jgi:hypothetical protein